MTTAHNRHLSIESCDARLEVRVTVHSGQARARRQTTRTEVIWSNRPIATQQSLPLINRSTP